MTGLYVREQSGICQVRGNSLDECEYGMALGRDETPRSACVFLEWSLNGALRSLAAEAEKSKTRSPKIIPVGKR